MNLIKRDNPFGGLDPLFDTDSFFNDFFWPVRKAGAEDVAALVAPRLDIHEQDNAYVVTTDLPGLNKDDIHLSVDDGVLTIKAETKKESDEKKEGKVIRRERHYGSYLRRLSLGNDVKQTDVDAEFKDGVLTITIPKHQPEKPEVKRISIR
ncbi:MAG TPA: Hsp20/alpha crystallin family protein [Pseudomonadales bacterium]